MGYVDSLAFGILLAAANPVAAGRVYWLADERPYPMTEIIDTVREEGKPERKRTWVMRPAGDNHFTGRLSDADGPVDIVVNGNNATVRYTMKDGGLKVVQQLQLQPDGKTLANHGVAKKFGLKFASVDGTIRKLD